MPIQQTTFRTKRFIFLSLIINEMSRKTLVRCLSVILLLLFTALLTHSVNANNLFLHNELQLELNIQGGFELIPERTGSRVESVSSQLLLYPKEDFRQKILEWQSLGDVANGRVEFSWNDKKLGEKEFGYRAIIKTNNELLRVQRKIEYPLSVSSISEYEEYLLPTETIDSSNLRIIQKANELAGNEDDLFKVVFNLASWVEGNVDYDLNTLTEGVSQKASWVLENRQGVCDEMTSLFIAMARSLGIPARFASGISYTTSDLFDENWQPHGWAEVYFPTVGWVAFDITFGEYGYVDVTHIKLRDGFDPQEPATRYEWFADAVQLETRDLNFEVNMQGKGEPIDEEILLEQELLAKEVGIGSYNLVKGVLKNTADYYLATTLQLATPQEISVLGRNKRTILLSPKEVRETFWVVKVREDLDNRYSYSFPLLIYSEKNVSIRGQFSAQDGGSVYSKAEIDEVVVKDEEKSYSRRITFHCDYLPEIPFRQETEASCSVENKGNRNLREVEFCLNNICDTIDLSVRGKDGIAITLKADRKGWNKLLVSAENEFIEKKSSFNYLVLDPPSVRVSIESPGTIMYGEDLNILFSLEKNSFAVPKNVIIVVEGPSFRNQWQIDSLARKEETNLRLTSFPLSRNNKFMVTTMWKDSEGRLFSDKQEFKVKGEARDFTDRLKMAFNGIAKLFMFSKDSH